MIVWHFSFFDTAYWRIFSRVLNVQSGPRDFFLKIDSCFRWCIGLRCNGRTLRQRRHAIRRASMSRLSYDVILFSIHLPFTSARARLRCTSRHRPTKKEHREPARGGREFRSVGLIKERGTNCSIDIFEGPHAWYNKAWARSNRAAGQVRGQALSVNQGKWFVKGRARACEIGHACATQRGVSPASITACVHACLL